MVGEAHAVGALREHDVDAGLKWPNDVMAGDQKLAGILAERVETPTGPAAVLGIGLNVDQTREELPVETATSIALVTGSAPDRTGLLASLVTRLGSEYDAWQAGGGPALRAAYLHACVTVGRRVRVSLPGGEELVGEAEDVDDAGRLVVAGTPVSAGDVVHVRPTVL